MHWLYPHAIFGVGGTSDIEWYEKGDLHSSIREVKGWFERYEKGNLHSHVGEVKGCFEGIKMV